ncbi:MAG: ECF-type sigma factor, partial [Planctomycetota bacterium]
VAPLPTPIPLKTLFLLRANAVVIKIPQPNDRFPGNRYASSMKSDNKLGSISHWLANPGNGPKPCGAQLLMQRFCARLTRLARRQLHSLRDPAYDEEDLALSTIQALHQKLTKDSLSRPANREQLWKLLVSIALNKSRNVLRQNARLRRPSDNASKGLIERRTREAHDLMTQSPEWPSMIADQCEFLLRLLDRQDSSGELRKIALMRLDGASKAQIASELGYTRFTISARINLIQAIWQYHLKMQID